MIEQVSLDSSSAEKRRDESMHDCRLHACVKQDLKLFAFYNAYFILLLTVLAILKPFFCICMEPY